MLIVFEGPAGSGKSTLSVALEEYLNTKYRSEDGTLKLDPHLGDFVWTREPSFLVEEANVLNLNTDEYEREKEFFISRLKHQDVISGRNIICDGYTWGGIAYSNMLSPGCWNLLKELYLSETLFIQPDLYIFVDTPIEICLDRNPAIGMEWLKNTRAAYSATRKYITTPVLTVQSIGGEDCAMEILARKFDEYVSMYNLSADDTTW